MFSHHPELAGFYWPLAETFLGRARDALCEGPVRWPEAREIGMVAGTRPVDTIVDAADLPLEPGGAPQGYLRYKTDALWAEFSFQSSANNRETFAEDGLALLRIRAFDMTGQGLDTNPGTVADFIDGAWSGYENTSGLESDFGGRDQNIELLLSVQEQADPYLLQPGIAAAWYDPTRSGEGFIIEMLANDVAVLYWFTYDDEGNQDWYIAGGTVEGNRLRFPELLRVSGGVTREERRLSLHGGRVGRLFRKARRDWRSNKQTTDNDQS